MSIQLTTLENGKVIRRSISLESAQADSTLREAVKCDQPGQSKAWFRSACGLDQPQELPALSSVVDAPLPTDIMPHELSHQPQPQHILQKTALLIRHITKNLFKVSGIHRTKTTTPVNPTDH